jgi:hypothetical protein
MGEEQPTSASAPSSPAPIALPVMPRVLPKEAAQKVVKMLLVTEALRFMAQKSLLWTPDLQAGSNREALEKTSAARLLALKVPSPLPSGAS